jgi:molecular chaperone GrpE
MTAKRPHDPQAGSASEPTLAPNGEAPLPAAFEAGSEAAAASEAPSEAPNEAPPEALAALGQEREQLLRLLAERDNQVKRMQRDQEREALRLRGDLALLLLPVMDDLERALAQLPPAGEEDLGHAEGLRLIAQRFQDLLAAFGLEPVAALGERFDPRFHEAVVQLPVADAERGTVIQELQKGYRLGELLIRPAKVAVAG